MLTLRPADHTPLRHPPLPLVVAQARFAAREGVEISNEVAARFQATLREAGPDFNRVVPVQTGDIVFGPGVQPATSTSNGFQFVPDDQSWIVTLMPDSVSLETPSFASFAEQFGPILDAVLQATAAVVTPVSLTRAGLRFVNVLKSPDGRADWSRWLRPALVAPHVDDLLATGIVNHSQQLVLDVAPGVRSAVRTGPAKAGDEDAFLLDIDTFAEPASLWVTTAVIELFGNLNANGVALFQSLITADMFAHLKGGQEVGLDV